MEKGGRKRGCKSVLHSEQHIKYIYQKYIEKWSSNFAGIIVDDTFCVCLSN